MLFGYQAADDVTTPSAPFAKIEPGERHVDPCRQRGKSQDRSSADYSEEIET
jgi:hypothetical protein